MWTGRPSEAPCLMSRISASAFSVFESMRAISVTAPFSARLYARVAPTDPAPTIATLLDFSSILPPPVFPRIYYNAVDSIRPLAHPPAIGQDAQPELRT